MSLQKQTISINFSAGVDTKTDPNQLQVGKFTTLVNSVFDKLGRLTKRNGFGFITPLPNNSSSYLTTFNGNLTAIGHDIKALASGPGVWVTKGQLDPVQVASLPLIRSNTNQSYVDTAISPNGLVCTAFTDNVPIGSTTTQSIQKFAVADVTTGQNVIAPQAISSTFGTVSFQSRVFYLNNKFVVVFPTYNGSTYHLQYLPISTITPGLIGSVTEISTSFTPSVAGAFDGVVANSNLFLSWNGAGNSGVKALYMDQSLTQSAAITIASSAATIVSACADITQGSPIFWSSFYFLGSSSAYSVALSIGSGLTPLFSAVKVSTSTGSAVLLNMASTAQNMNMNLWYEVNNKYSYLASSTSYINQVSVTQTASVSNTITLQRGLGLASKGFIIGSQNYFMGVYASPYQPTYFLIGTADSIVAKLAYQNGPSWLGSGLPSVTVTGSTTARVGYLFKDLVQAVNKDTNVLAGTQVNGIYAQTGVNLATFKFGTDKLVSTETGGALNLSGGYLNSYDGYQIVENGFHVFPEEMSIVVGSGGAGLQAQTYFYSATYEWSDNQGNLWRSAPSIPSGPFVIGTGDQLSAIVNVPTLRLTNKTQNPVKIVLYRWSTAQQIYYQVTSIQVPIPNNKTIDSIAYNDSASDASILGNNILYTNGGVVENIGAPACVTSTIFDSRLWLIDAEDRNLLWFSKQVIEATPVEMSDLFTIFVPPSSGAQGPTGPMTCLAPMDDKLIIFKKNAIYFLNGVGPDNTGANNQYSQPVFITGTIGCENQNSIVMTPNGLMFQSDKGIWLLGRDLSTQYIGKDVEAYNSNIVLSSLTVPATNQVRFTLNSGMTLMYDYFVNQWGTFFGIPGVSSTIYKGLHSFINSQGQALQETPGLYVDGSNPVLMSFTTGWLNLAGLQGYQRIYRMYILGNYQSPHTLNVGIAYDYDSAVSQLIPITPLNYSSPWGGDTTWGSGAEWGGPSQVEQWQVNFQKQSCQTFQLSLNEFFDSSLGTPTGAGLTISGMDLVYGQSKGFPRDIGKDNKVG